MKRFQNHSRFACIVELSSALCAAFFAALSLLAGCANRPSAPTVWVGDEIADYSLEIHNLSLKYALVDTADQLYSLFAMSDGWRGEFYAREIPETWRWMEATWKAFTPQMRADLQYCMKRQHPWGILQNLSALPDNAGIDEIIARVEASSYSSGFKERFARFYRAFYRDFYAEHFAIARAALEPQVKELTIQAGEFSFGPGRNIFDYMEAKTGLAFSSKRKPVFYLLEFPVGAYGFDTPNRKISTVQAGADDLRILYATAFHEYSHELFRPIEKSSEFRAASKRLRANRALFASWDENLKRSYSWDAYVAENVVNGLSYYLMFEYAGKEQQGGDYVFDDDISRYLSGLPFDPAKMSLKDAVLGYLSTL